MRWDIQCPGLGLYSQGEDIVEPAWTGDGHDFDLSSQHFRLSGGLRSVTQKQSLRCRDVRCQPPSKV